MARKGPRITSKLSDFDVYIKRVIVFLEAIVPPAVITNGARLGLTPLEITAAHAFLTQWFTGIPATPGAYEFHTNPDTKTKATRQQVVNIIKNFSIFFRPLLDRMSGSASINSDDRLILNIAEPGDQPSTPQTPMTESVFFEGKQIGGGTLRFTCRTTSDTKRASKPERADSVQISYKIGDPPPAHFDDATSKEVFTKAVFNLVTGAGNTGRKLHCFLRWSNTKHPEIAGPWGEVKTITIL